MRPRILCTCLQQSPLPERYVTLKVKKKAKRSKTYKITHLSGTSDTQSSNVSPVTNEEIFLKTEQQEKISPNFVNCSPNDKSSSNNTAIPVEIQETRMIFKEPTWNAEKLEISDSICSVKSEILLSTKSPKVIKKNTISTKVANNFDEFKNESHEDLMNKNIPSKFIFDDYARYEPDSCPSTCRSIKTELLLKPTKEIGKQLLKNAKNKAQHDDDGNDSNNNVGVDNIFQTSQLPSKALNEKLNGVLQSEEHADDKETLEEREHSDDSIEFSSVQSSPYVQSTKNNSSITNIQNFLDQLENNYEPGSNNKEIFQKNDVESSDNFAEDGIQLKEPQKTTRPRTSTLKRNKATPVIDSYHEDLNTNRSINTGVSLGQEIVQMSRLNTYTPPVIINSTKRKMFVPPHRKADDLSSVTSKTSSSLISVANENIFLRNKNVVKNNALKYDKEKSRFNSSRSAVRISASINNVNKSRRDSIESGSTISNANLAINGSSVKGRPTKNFTFIETQNSPKPLRKDNVSCLTSLMKHSAQIQIISGNLLEFMRFQ
ncbi:hypothetical protein HELRODRAFT_162216 [Helobdella robusta]|uniref:Uncharacterized protein n=1 Tax=Helobdella robusta TaxID=6412 RepID=T1ESD1_HELRO|nr:hypothetical protein HELRODRAFT_162216 [Helobdella robusta]ESN98761.1 hypothetical protein HELRODRAFT_162216 [Helobdella robusta]